MLELGTPRPPPGAPTDLLLLFHGLVQKDQGPPGLCGKVACGIRTATQEVWWQVTFGERAIGAFVERSPTDAGATLLVGAREATSFLETGAFPAQPTLLSLTGDRALFSRFVVRYVQQKKSVDVRAAAYVRSSQSNRSWR